MEKEREIEQTLKSLEGIERAGPGQYFFSRWKARMSAGQQTVIRPKRIPAWVSFSFLLILVNLFVFWMTLRIENSQETAMENIIEEYGMTTSLYDLNE